MITPEILQQVAVSVLEEAAFVFPEPSAGGGEWPPVAASIEFHGAGEGRVVIAADPGLALEIAANLLGVDSASAEAVAHRQAAVAELLNILAGTLLVRAFGTDARIRMGLPADGVPAGECGMMADLAVGSERLRVGVAAA